MAQQGEVKSKFFLETFEVTFLTGTNLIIDIDTDTDDAEEGIDGASVLELREWFQSSLETIFGSSLRLVR
jgi:hypothetical protein